MKRNAGYAIYAVLINIKTPEIFKDENAIT
jgi:hypothetical protein